MATAAEFSAMQRAIVLADAVDFPPGPNPRVGAVILSPDGKQLGEGAHRGPGTAHAEVAALQAAGESSRGATAVVTLEPCAHVGRTGACSRALIDAGIARVVFAQTDPNSVAAGGADELRAAGIVVEGGLLADEAYLLNEEWSIAVARQRPYVTLKIASSLDGRIAASDGSSRWITGPLARDQVHLLRSQSDAVVVGTGTVIADDPELTDRRDDATWQPRPIVVGEREIPTDSKLNRRDPVLLKTHDLDHVLTTLYAMEFRRLLIEAGPTLATAFIRSGLVDRMVWYIAPVLLGEGLPALSSLGITTIDEASRWTRVSTQDVGQDVRIDLVPSASVRSGG